MVYFSVAFECRATFYGEHMVTSTMVKAYAISNLLIIKKIIDYRYSN